MHSSEQCGEILRCPGRDVISSHCLAYVHYICGMLVSYLVVLLVVRLTIEVS